MAQPTRHVSCLRDPNLKTVYFDRADAFKTIENLPARLSGPGNELILADVSYSIDRSTVTSHQTGIAYDLLADSVTADLGGIRLLRVLRGGRIEEGNSYHELKCKYTENKKNSAQHAKNTMVKIIMQYEIRMGKVSFSPVEQQLPPSPVPPPPVTPQPNSVRRTFQIRRDFLMEHKDEIGRTNTLPVQVHVQVEQNDSRQLGAPRPTRATSIGDVPNARMEGSKVDNAPGAAGLPQPGVDKYVIPSASFLDGKYVVVFGVFPGYDIADVKAMVKSFGGEVRIRYSKGKTDFLLAEDDNRKKINDFKEKGGVEHITLAATLALLEKNTSVDEADHVGGGVNHYGAGVGAGVPSMAGAGDGASTGDELDAFKLKMAEMNFQKAKRIAELEVQQKEDTVKLDVQQKEHAAKLELQQKENMAKLELQQKELEVQRKKDTVETHERINKNKIAISDVEVEQVRMKVEQVRMKGDITKVGATANRADSKADEALESSKNANERVEGLHDQLSRTATKKDLQFLEERMKKEMRRSEDDGMNKDGGEDDGLVGAALDFSDSSSDDESVSSPRRAGVTAVTPMDKESVKVSRETYHSFSNLLTRAIEYGQEGKKIEMDAFIKEAEDIIVKTDLAEERAKFVQLFNVRSKLARKLCSQYGSKPAAR
eukprot:CAMPEP_0113387426 /NCGR_PEP_ID=MMETSP0013_2-20120614/8527_1 /TAXON_ID=2843 ORGANISM="Skeletonema costatum, Strain 1716" /NCGR_SAMPLE_ID=MMETSP0013_2 /ASSEMBLY_ACC=CAM_ASM_000158 /LENGTH=655 /DNA_ID=CAMNT_0000270315 /DNA_START=351 /DNA_END=2318 /DNA_ORIENTATION=- /assembly_acc=CAM_ASM_000158